MTRRTDTGPIPGLDRPLRAVAMSDEAGTAIRKPLRFHLGQKGFGFRLDRFGEQPASAFAQHRCQRIVDVVGVSKE